MSSFQSANFVFICFSCSLSTSLVFLITNLNIALRHIFLFLPVLLNMFLTLLIFEFRAFQCACVTFSPCRPFPLLAGPLRPERKWRRGTVNARC